MASEILQGPELHIQSSIGPESESFTHHHHTLSGRRHHVRSFDEKCFTRLRSNWRVLEIPYGDDTRDRASSFLIIPLTWPSAVIFGRPAMEVWRSAVPP